MNKYIENERELPIIASVDVLVCGGGPAGVGAAIRAGRMGVKTMVVEYMGALGGIATEGMMSHWVGRSSSTVMVEILDRMKQKCKDCLGYTNEKYIYNDAIHQDATKIVLDEMMSEANVQVLYYTKVCDAIVENNVIKGVIVENKSGRGVILAKCVVDSTGDGDVAAYAGVPYFKGRETDGRMQPCTMMFKIGGVDYSRAVFPPSFETKVETEKGELQALAKEKLPFPAGHVLLYPQLTENTVCCNMTNAIEIDATDAFSLTKGVQTCRSQIEPIIKFLREYAPGYENCWLMSTSSLLGVRETRHFEGVKSLIAEDILTAKQYDDWVVERAHFNFDVHNLTGASLDETGIQDKWQQDKDYTIPYGCLLPKNIDGLLLSGRNISGSHLAHSNFRVMPICIAIGEAAGIAGALSCIQNKTLKEINVADIQRIVSK